MSDPEAEVEVAEGFVAEVEAEAEAFVSEVEAADVEAVHVPSSSPGQCLTVWSCSSRRAAKSPQGRSSLASTDFISQSGVTRDFDFYRGKFHQRMHGK